MKVTKNLLDDIRQLPCTINNQAIAITATLAVCEMAVSESLSATVKRADKALYKGKESGQNQIVLADLRIE